MQHMSYNWAPKQEIADEHLLRARQRFRLGHLAVNEVSVTSK